MVSYAILILQFFCLSLWVGGSVILLTIVGPEVFRREQRSTGPEEMMTRILVRFNAVFLTSVLLLAGSLALQLAFLSVSLGPKLRIVLGLVLVAVSFALYARFSLGPRMKSLEFHDERDGPDSPLGLFRRLHARFLGILVVNLFLGIGVIMILLLPFS